MLETLALIGVVVLIVVVAVRTTTGDTKGKAGDSMNVRHTAGH